MSAGPTGPGPGPADPAIDRLLRRLERERGARKEAEQLLERKSAELFEANRSLRAFNDRLEALVVERTAELRDARDRAEAGTLAKSRFLATMSHEIRTPLNGVIGMIELLRGTPLDARQQDYLDSLLQSADTLLAIVNDVLDFSKIEAGRIELEQRGFDPLRLAQDVLTLMRPLADPKGLTLTLRAGALPARAVGDPNRLRQVWTNLLSNAIKFTARGEVGMALHAEPLAAGGWRLHGEVSDTGIGIAESQRDRVFEAFGQADSSTTRRYGGTGLGLAITARLVALMGGSITLSSVPGVGSRFGFTALLAAADPVPAAGAAEPEAADHPRPLERLRVLVAEDNPVNQTIAITVLERMGITATLVADGRAALQAVADGAFDVVLMDMQMPELDGVQATRAIRALGASVAQPWIIAVTANAFEQDRQRCLAAGMDDFVAKPYKPGPLREALQGARLRRADGPAAG